MIQHKWTNITFSYPQSHIFKCLHCNAMYSIYYRDFDCILVKGKYMSDFDNYYNLGTYCDDKVLLNKLLA